MMNYVQHFASNSIIIYVPKISSGTYIIAITLNNKAYTKKFQVIGN
ncbi:MAG: hypothetical protein IPP04_06900 [Saprospiraceae bacterium]|nr:hypothetical protein [Saprospiraceae bacterium]